MRACRRPARRAGLRLGAAALVATLIMMVFVAVGHADPTPAPGGSPSPTASESTSGSATAGPTSAPPSASAAASQTGSPTTSPRTSDRRQVQAAGQAAGLTLAVRSTYGSGAMFWSDIGKYAFRGSAGGLADGAPIEIYRRSGSTGWTRLTTGTVTSGAYAVDYPVLSHGTFTFIATSGGAPGTGDAVSSNSVTVTVGNSTVTFNRPWSRSTPSRTPG